MFDLWVKTSFLNVITYFITFLQVAKSIEIYYKD